MCDKSDAWLDGWFAHKKGQSNDDENNPYDEKRQARSFQQWQAGWCDRYAREKHGTYYSDQRQFPYDNALFGD